MADQLDELATLIADKALQRLRSQRIGATEPTCGPAPTSPPQPQWPSAQSPAQARTPASQPKECGSEGCAPCTENGTCEARAMSLTAARFTPLAIRTSRDIAPYIDHTLLKADATREELIKLCDEARKWGFATVCVNSSNVALCKRLLEGTSTKPIAVVGFPLGAASSSSKAFETREAVRAGAAEIDMVINIGALKSKEYGQVECDIRSVVEAARPAPVKVILETGGLTRDEKVIACALSKAAGAAFVKTSTGFGPGGATAEDIALMREIVGPEMGVKASGGVRTTADAEKMLAAGATRVGASASVGIVTNIKPAVAAKY